MALHNDIGKWGEDIATQYLKEHGWYIRHRDWHSDHRDIDIVAIDADMTTLLIVEVKTRTSDWAGKPDEAIDLRKKNNIIKSADNYVHQYHLDYLDVRYDTISIIGTPDKGYTIEHKENAFGVIERFMFYEEKRVNAPYRYKKRPGCWQ